MAGVCVCERTRARPEHRAARRRRLRLRGHTRPHPPDHAGLAGRRGGAADWLAAVVGGVARAAGWDFGERLASIWPYAILTTLLLFLVLQFLPFLLPKKANKNADAEGSFARDS